MLLALACTLVPAAAAAPALAQDASEPVLNTTTTSPSGGTSTGAAPEAEAAGTRLQRSYRRWRSKLRRYGVWHGRNLVYAAQRLDRPPTATELRRSIRRMRTRFTRWLRTPDGRSVLFALKVRRIPDWGRAHLRSIASCESRSNPRAIGGGGAYRGMYQFSFSTWAVVGGYGDPAAASRSEQTWRAWLLLSRHGSGHWPVCG
jgi:hypothetical protein